MKIGTIRSFFFTAFVVTSVLIVLLYLKHNETVLYTVTLPQDLAAIHNHQLKKISPHHPALRQNLWVDLQPKDNMLVRKLVLQYVQCKSSTKTYEHVNVANSPFKNIKYIITHQTHCFFKVVEGICRF